MAVVISKSEIDNLLAFMSGDGAVSATMPNGETISGADFVARLAVVKTGLKVAVDVQILDGEDVTNYAANEIIPFP